MLALGQMLSFAVLLFGRMGGEGSGPAQGSAQSGHSNRQGLLVEIYKAASGVGRLMELHASVLTAPLTKDVSESPRTPCEQWNHCCLQGQHGGPELPSATWALSLSSWCPGASHSAIK